MARSEVRTKLPLDRWAEIVGINPLHFNGVFVRTPRVCAQPWLQFPWQAADRVGREDVAYAIAQAEADIERYLGFKLVPTWEVEEWEGTERPRPPELINLTSTDIRGFAQLVEARWGHFITGGIRGSTLLGAARPITYSDPDGDLYFELATVTATVDSGTDPCEVRPYFPVTNPMVDTGGEEQWEIRPVSVSVSGTTATITFAREQAVLPELQVDRVPPADDSHFRGVDGTEDANFLTTVDVYRVFNDPQTQVTLMWEPFGTGCSCNGGCNLCAFSTQTGCLMPRGNPRLGMVAYRPGTWDATDEVFDSAELAVARQPDMVRLFYYAGLRDRSLSCPAVRMSAEWQRAVAYYAAALLDRPLCECDNIHSWIENWRRDLAVPGRDEGLQVSPEDLNNPLGTRRGAVSAWKRVVREALGRAV